MLGQLLTAALLLTGVVGVGSAIATALAAAIPLPRATQASLVPLTGIAALGLVTLVVGYLHGLGPWLPWGWAAAGLVAFVARAGVVVPLFGMIAGDVARHVRRQPISLTAVSIGFAMAAVAALALPSRTDEIQYHWPAPLAWAEAGHWTESPFRHVNGFPFMEIVYTSAATQGGYVAAHLLSLATLVGLGFAAAGLASSMGLRGIGQVAAAAVCMRVVWDSAYVAYSDTPVGAFATAAVAVALAGVQSGRLVRSTMLSAALVAIETSIKPTGAASAGVVALVLLLAVKPRHRTWTQALQHVIKPWLILAGAAAASVAFWSIRQLVVTGHLIDPQVTATPDAYALTMLPNTVERIIEPVIPFVSGIIGGIEPWGGRTSLVVQIFLVPAIVYVVLKRGRVAHRFATLVVPAWIHWIVVGVAILRTRFHIISWVLLVVGVRTAVEDAQERYPRWGPWLERVWTAGVVLGLIDVAVPMVRTITTI